MDFRFLGNDDQGFFEGFCLYYKTAVFADAALQIFTNFIPDNSGA